MRSLFSTVGGFKLGFFLRNFFYKKDKFLNSYRVFFSANMRSTAFGTPKKVSWFVYFYGHFTATDKLSYCKNTVKVLTWNPLMWANRGTQTWTPVQKSRFKNPFNPFYFWLYFNWNVKKPCNFNQNTAKSQMGWTGFWNGFFKWVFMFVYPYTPQGHLDRYRTVKESRVHLVIRIWRADRRPSGLRITLM